MIPIANRPILEYAVDALAANALNEITMVVGYKKERIMSHFEDGGEWGVKIKYVEQKRRVAKAGTAYALSMAKKSVKGDFLMLPGDNIIGAGVIADLIKAPGKYRLVITESDMPSKYGVVELSGKVIRNIVEKPEQHMGNLISTGIYKFSDDIFKVVDEVMKEGKYDLTSVLQSMIPKTKVTAVKTKGLWNDVVYPWDMLELNALALRKCPAITSGRIDKNVTIKGPVGIGEGTIIRSGTHIMGPVVIGEGCEIGPSVCIYPSTSIGDNVRIGPFSVVEHSILMNDVTLGSGSHLSHSVLAEGVETGPQFCASEDEAGMRIEGEFTKVDRLGALVGNRTVIGGQVSVKAGSIIGSRCRINTQTRIDGNIEDKTRVM